MCPFGFVSSILPLFPSVLYHFLLLGLHSSVSVSSSLSLISPLSPKSERTHIKNSKSVDWIRLTTLLQADNFLLFFLHLRRMRCFEKGQRQEGISWRCHSAECISFIQRWQLRGHVSSRRNTQHATCKLLQDAHALELHTTAFLMWEMPVLLVGLEAKVTCF